MPPTCSPERRGHSRQPRNLNWLVGKTQLFQQDAIRYKPVIAMVGPLSKQGRRWRLLLRAARNLGAWVRTSAEAAVSRRSVYGEARSRSSTPASAACREWSAACCRLLRPRRRRSARRRAGHLRPNHSRRHRLRPVLQSRTELPVQVRRYRFGGDLGHRRALLRSSSLVSSIIVASIIAPALIW